MQKTLKQLSTSILQKQICLKIQVNYFALGLIEKIFFEVSIKNYLSEEFVTVKQNGDSLGEMKDVISTNRCVNKSSETMYGDKDDKASEINFVVTLSSMIWLS
jgi:hypothetical protein